MHPEIFARLAPLPAKVKAVTVTDDNLVFNVFVSEYLCERSRLAALNHELNHIYENHFTDQAIPIELLYVHLVCLTLYGRNQRAQKKQSSRMKKFVCAKTAGIPGI